MNFIISKGKYDYINMNNNIILIDLPYFIYTVIFISKYLFNNKYKNDDKNFDFIKNPYFQKILKKKIMNKLYKIKNYFNVNFDNIVLVRDCLREEIWRNKFYPKYKKNRPDSSTSEIEDNIGNIFIYLYNEFFPSLKKYNIKSVLIDEVEADDIIFVFSNIIKKNKKVIIISNDSDFYQILDDNVKMYDISLKEKGQNNDKKNILLYKILRGDKSDNISGFRIKKKDFYENKINYRLIYQNIRTYFMNRKLINGKCIPLYLKEKIYDKYVEIF